jgi:Toprim domain-containing protein
VISQAGDLARRLARDAEAVCRHYLSKGRRSGRYWIIGDVQNTPGRSLYVRLQGPDYGPGAAGHWTDSATGEHGDLLDLIRHNRDHHRIAEAMDEARLFLALPRPAIQPSAYGNYHASPARHRSSSEAARRLFHAGRPVPGTPAETYLRARGITARLDWPALRFHPSVYYRADDNAELELWPALLAAVTAPDGTINGIQRTWLDRDRPAKAPLADPRRALGRLLGNGVRIGKAADIVAAGEGIETMLALKSVLPDLPMIAGLSANHLAALDLPSSLRRLYVARDNDVAGLRAFQRLRQRNHGIDVREFVPLHDDFNRDLCRLGAEDLRARLTDQLVPDDRPRLDPE